MTSSGGGGGTRPRFSPRAVAIGFFTVNIGCGIFCFGGGTSESLEISMIGRVEGLTLSFMTARRGGRTAAFFVGSSWSGAIGPRVSSSSDPCAGLMLLERGEACFLDLRGDFCSRSALGAAPDGRGEDMRRARRRLGES